MSWAFSKKIASRYLWSRRREAFITIISLISVLGIAIGVIVINVTMAIMTGFQYELRQKVLGADSHIMLRSLNGLVKNWEDLAGEIKSSQGVLSVSPFTHNQALLRTESVASGVLLRGVMPGTASEKQLSSYLEEGYQVSKLHNPPAVEVRSAQGDLENIRLPGMFIGKEMARSHGLVVGQTVSVLSARVGATPLGLAPKYRRFVIAGIYNSGLVNYESSLAYISLEDAQRFFRLGLAVSGLEVRVHDLDQAPQLAKQILDKLGGFAAGLYTQDWTQTHKPLWDALRLEKRVYFIVLLLLIVLASFSIVSTLVLLVMEKRGDIAILKTMGASSGSIGNIFRIQGATVGGIGTLLGSVLGLLACLALRKYGFPIDERIFHFSEVPVRVEAANFIIVAVCAFLISCLATIYPSWRASGLKPAEILRYE